MTVKPVLLISHLIRLFTQEGQTVLDPFVGSGSHGVAALQNNRNFVGFEIEKKYYEIAGKRLRLTLDENVGSFANKKHSSLPSVKQFRNKRENLLLDFS
jgi:DNA modification methylase